MNNEIELSDAKDIENIGFIMQNTKPEKCQKTEEKNAKFITSFCFLTQNGRLLYDLSE